MKSMWIAGNYMDFLESYVHQWLHTHTWQQQVQVQFHVTVFKSRCLSLLIASCINMNQWPLVVAVVEKKEECSYTNIHTNYDMCSREIEEKNL